jgi:hypothetical protein
MLRTRIVSFASPGMALALGGLALASPASAVTASQVVVTVNADTTVYGR